RGVAVLEDLGVRRAHDVGKPGGEFFRRRLAQTEQCRRGLAFLGEKVELLERLERAWGDRRFDAHHLHDVDGHRRLRRAVAQLIERSSGGWLAISPPASDLRIAVEAATPAEAAATFAKAEESWAVLLRAAAQRTRTDS